MENTLENAIQFMNDRYGQDIEDILVAYAIPFESQIAENKATYAEEKLMLIATIQRLRAELERVKVVVPSEEDLEDCIEDFDPYTFESHEVAFYEGTKWMANKIKSINPTLTFAELNNNDPTGDKQEGDE